MSNFKDTRFEGYWLIEDRYSGVARDQNQHFAAAVTALCHSEIPAKSSGSGVLDASDMSARNAAIASADPILMLGSSGVHRCVQIQQLDIIRQALITARASSGIISALHRQMTVLRHAIA